MKKKLLGEVLSSGSSLQATFLSFSSLTAPGRPNSALSLEFLTSAILTPQSICSRSLAKPQRLLIWGNNSVVLSAENPPTSAELFLRQLLHQFVYECPLLCYLRSSRIKDLILSSNFSFQTSLSFIQLSWTGCTNCSVYMKLLIEHPGFFKEHGRWDNHDTNYFAA